MVTNRWQLSSWTDLLLEILAKCFDFFDQGLKLFENLVVNAVGQRHDITSFCEDDVQGEQHQPVFCLFATCPTLFSCDGWLL